MNDTLLAISMIVGGLCLTIGGVVVLMRRQPESPIMAASSPAPLSTPADAPRQKPEPQIRGEKRIARDEPQPSEEKGIQFEKWVVKRLTHDFYTIKEWRGDKYVDGIYAESTTNPDLEVEFHMGRIRKPFAIECKWRQGYDQGEKPYIVWASERQIENYRGFAEARNVPVFVVIGVGGKPDDPDEVFIVNLNSLKYPKATAEYLGQFRRRNKNLDFYYDYKKPELK